MTWVSGSLVANWKNREDGAIPSRSRRCNRGRMLQQATVIDFTGRRSTRTIRKPEDLPEISHWEDSFEA